MVLFKNIVSNPQILNGKPCIKGTRISIELIMEWLATGGSIAAIVAKHPLLTPEKVARFAKNEIIIEVKAA
jgi:uncharacterized protein (DUF433 family)